MSHFYNRLNCNNKLIPDCEPRKMWIYGRHGTRLPTSEFIIVFALDHHNDVRHYNLILMAFFSSIFEYRHAEKDIERLPSLEEFRDDIIANYEKRHSKPPIGAMCENDLDLLKQWHWNR